MDDIYIDLNFLTESERDALQDVLARDEEFRRQEKKRLSALKKELDVVKQSGARAESSESTTKVCARCQESFGVVFNTGAFCPKCKARVCKNCRNSLKDSWLCTLCAKVRDVKAKSGAWFFEQSRVSKGEARTLFGTSLIRASLKRGKPQAKRSEVITDEPPAPPVIGLNLQTNEKLHRPIPVHMSAIRESEGNDSSYHTAESTDDYDSPEVNKNYIKPYAKAVPVKRGSQEEGEYSDKDESPAETSSGCSTPTTVHDMSKVSDTIQNESLQNEREKERAEEDRYDNEEEEKPVFDYLSRDQHSPSRDQYYSEQQDEEDDERNLEDSDEYKSVTSQGSQGYYYNSGSREHYPLPGMKDEYSPPPKDLESLNVNQEWTLNAEANADSLDSFRTADFQTPFETPANSDFDTPMQSLTSDNDSNFIDARDTTPVPPDDEEHYAGYTLEETYIDGEKVVPPEIVTTAVDDEHDRKNDNDEPAEDIDQAFAEYGVDLNNKSLSDRFDMGSRESIVSYYSEAGEGYYGTIPITGEVQFGLKYDFRLQKLEIQVHRAKDIAPVDTKKNRSDPYVKAYLLPDKTKGGKRKTKVKKNTLNPEFDEILSFKISFDELLTRSLWLCVWNNDRFGHNDFLGEVLLPMATYEQSGFSWEDPSAQWYPLRERRPEQSLMEYSGELVIALKYVPQGTVKHKKGFGKKKKEGGELHVQIKEAHNLKAKDANGFSDPFCKVYLLPDKSKKTKRKTQTIKKNLNPKWNISFVYDHLTLEELMDRSLEVTVWDWDRGASNDFLGGLRLGMGAKTDSWDDAEGEEIAAWQKMLDYQNEWNECTIALRSSMHNRK